MKRIIKFYADWCHPCKVLSRTLEEIQTDIPIENINIDEKMNICHEYGIRGVPTMIMLDGNIEIKRKSGNMPKDELEEWIASN